MFTCVFGVLVTCFDNNIRGVSRYFQLDSMVLLMDILTCLHYIRIHFGSSHFGSNLREAQTHRPLPPQAYARNRRADRASQHLP